jgi:acyl dehydratase
VNKTYYFEDLTVGLILRSSSPRRMEAERIKSFAREFDPQPAHLDEAAASSTPFGQLVASGWHTAAATMRLVLDVLPIAEGGQGLGLDKLTWTRPVLPDDELRVEIKVLELRASRSRPDRGVVTLEITTLNQKDQPVQSHILRSLFPRRREQAANPGLA